jgi:acetyl-CoA carboxylase carboxyltransferase component
MKINQPQKTITIDDLLNEYEEDLENLKSAKQNIIDGLSETELNRADISAKLKKLDHNIRTLQNKIMLFRLGIPTDPQ